MGQETWRWPSKEETVYFADENLAKFIKNSKPITSLNDKQQQIVIQRIFNNNLRDDNGIIERTTVRARID